VVTFRMIIANKKRKETTAVQPSRHFLGGHDTSKKDARDRFHQQASK
jgi:hypothetical protein